MPTNLSEAKIRNLIKESGNLYYYPDMERDYLNKYFRLLELSFIDGRRNTFSQAERLVVLDKSISFQTENGSAINQRGRQITSQRQESDYPFSTTPSPERSPSRASYGYTYRPGSSPRRHSRNEHLGNGYAAPQKRSSSPRYNSSGYYATVACTGAYAYDREGSPPSEPSPLRSHREPSSTQRAHSARPTKTRNKLPPTPKATDADARKHGIPLGYSLKNWDPAEEPFVLLGSVFDANSLGKWIYDWIAYHHGPATPIADLAGELWLLLTQLTGKVKRAEEVMPHVFLEEKLEMVEDFIESGERLTGKFKKLLKSCQTLLLKVGKNKITNSDQLGKNAGTGFVNTLFGPDRQLDVTEKFMSSIRLWNLRFDTNCEDVLRNPGDKVDMTPVAIRTAFGLQDITEESLNEPNVSL